MKWRKLGLIFPAPEKDPVRPWLQSHAANPVLRQTDGDLFELFFSSRDSSNRAHVASASIELRPPFRTVTIRDTPHISPGATGLFDDSGTSLSCIQTIAGTEYLFYLGWNLGVTVPWRNSVGAAALNKTTGKYEKVSLAPILDRSSTDPYSVSYPFVFPDNDRIRVYYGSNLSWGKEQSEMSHVLKYAEGTDALTWKPTGKIAVGFNNKDEYAISRPCVLKENGVYKMWYSFRGAAYRIGYAESADGIEWERMDHRSGIDVSESGWDSEMICYPFVFDHAGNRYLAYNGNRYGLTGIGLAILER